MVRLQDRDRRLGTLLDISENRRYFSVGSMAKVDAVKGGEDPKKLIAQIS
jgi:hypothetical protein